MLRRVILPMLFALMTICEGHCVAQINMANDALVFKEEANRCKKKKSRYALNNPKYKRVVFLSRQDDATDPLADPNHCLAKKLQYKNGTYFYTQQQLDELDNRVFANLYSKYGIDLQSVIPAADGTRVVPGVGFGFPVLIGRKKQAFIVSDSRYPARDQNVSDRWLQIEVAYLFVFNATYTVPAGFIMEGAEASPGWVYGEGDFNWVRNHSNVAITTIPCDEVLNLQNNPYVFSCRELLTFTTNTLNIGVVDQWGRPGYIITCSVTDQNGRNGEYIAATARLREPIGASAAPVVTLYERAVITWDCP